MPRIAYITKKFKDASLLRIRQANQIIADYQAQGFTLTLRQLYYQFVSRDWIPNNDKEYDKLGALITDARLAGLIDWDAIEDRTRNLKSMAHWDSPGSIVDACASQYHVDFWDNQSWRPEVWIEKEALAGVFDRVCRKLDVPYFSCRGYGSASEMWRAGRRMKDHLERGQTPIIFHFGDHDPSGMDMTRDIRDRLAMFAEEGIEVQRIALNMDQIEEYGPPPNPAKITDSRANAYIDLYGDESWELDALEPSVLMDMAENAIRPLIDVDYWADKEREENEARLALSKIAGNFDTALEAVS